ncbi:MAG: hypothetical protein GOMPHAMPRED_007697 [Gomphillus americanus]|uniref:Uncharacterized protein n=1 Tax=Gomphillus americanus TaxID=1940652 RepID=A0A8H3EYE1_9LECA|nr:MAG: hypothetical protein GOMPHAMPRED_007697 [Gomphillus americanus]
MLDSRENGRSTSTSGSHRVQTLTKLPLTLECPNGRQSKALRNIESVSWKFTGGNSGILDKYVPGYQLQLWVSRDVTRED